jgi:hypothetical protein
MDLVFGAALALGITGVWAVLLRRFPPNWQMAWWRVPYLTIPLTVLFAVVDSFYGRETVLYVAALVLVVVVVTEVRRAGRAHAIEEAIARLVDVREREAGRAELMHLAGPSAWT